MLLSVLVCYEGGVVQRIRYKAVTPLRAKRRAVKRWAVIGARSRIRAVLVTLTKRMVKHFVVRRVLWIEHRSVSSRVTGGGEASVGSLREGK